jgi:hypothetical protein
MHPLKPVRSKLPRLAILLAGVACLGLAGCDDHAGDPKVQIGANPVLPALQQYLMPPMAVAKVVGWEKQAPTVAEGLQVHALATGFAHPRSLYVLPNGDVLVVESNGPKAPIYRPKDIITGWVQSFAGAKAKDANRITLLRDTDGDGTFKTRTVFLDHLNSPFGVALVGNPIRTDKPASPPQGQNSPIFPAGRSIITGPRLCWPVRTAPSSMSESDRTATSAKMESAPNMNAPRSGRSTAHRARIASTPAEFAIPPGCSGSPRPASSGPSPTNATRSGPTSFRTI